MWKNINTASAYFDFELAYSSSVSTPSSHMKNSVKNFERAVVVGDDQHAGLVFVPDLAEDLHGLAAELADRPVRGELFDHDIDDELACFWIGLACAPNHMPGEWIVGLRSENDAGGLIG